MLVCVDEALVGDSVLESAHNSGKIIAMAGNACLTAGPVMFTNVTASELGDAFPFPASANLQDNGAIVRESPQERIVNAPLGTSALCLVE
ncbi:hypothetical protein PoB_004886600 [Plakobranchus ocellatus]|uniref:Uncharacterized protein n=1 Tax=Plakobranchus ocellatus TaxID=259542 RepID=A0AAV4BG96_9GAST|nr:hypothetical protein PoB_004886600 [Plakobranchus ocellatus]